MTVYRGNDLDGRKLDTRPPCVSLNIRGFGNCVYLAKMKAKIAHRRRRWSDALEAITRGNVTYELSICYPVFTLESACSHADYESTRGYTQHSVSTLAQSTLGLSPDIGHQWLAVGLALFSRRPPPSDRSCEGLECVFIACFTMSAGGLFDRQVKATSLS